MIKLIFIILLQLLFQQIIHAETIKESCLSKNTVKDDFIELYSKLQSSHYNLFINTSKDVFDKLHNEKLNEINDCMTIDELTLFFQKLVSKSNIAHARIELPTHLYTKYQDDGGSFFPIYIKSDGTFLTVAENYSANKKIKTGDKIVEINDVKVENLLIQLRQYLSADTKLMFGGFLEFYLGMLLWFEYGELDEFKLTLETNGNQYSTKVHSITVEQRTKRSKNLKKPLQLDWERIAEVKQNNIAYLRPGPFFNHEGSPEEVWNNQSFVKFIDESFANFIKEKTQAILVDLRNNPGGDSSFSDPLIKWIANKPFKFASTFNVKVSEEFRESNEKRLITNTADELDEDNISMKYKKAYENKKNGTYFEYQFPLIAPYKKKVNVPVYFLINRHSYSNAVTVAAMAQDYEFATIIGEETADLATTYGAMESFELTNSKIKVGFPKAFIVRPNGDEQVRGVVPDIHISTPLFEDINDPVLNKSLNLIQKRHKEDR